MNVTPWVIRRKPGNKKLFEVVSYDGERNKLVIAKEFKDIVSAQQFADEANRMLSIPLQQH